MPDSQNITRLNALGTQYKAALDEHAKLYPQYKVFNDSPTISKNYANNESKLANISATLFNFQNNIETNSISLSDGAMRFDDEITKLYTENKKLKQKLSSLKGRKEGAQGMYVDSKYIYQQYYLGNWLLVLSMLGMGIIYKKNQQQNIY